MSTGAHGDRRIEFVVVTARVAAHAGIGKGPGLQQAGDEREGVLGDRARSAFQVGVPCLPTPHPGRISLPPADGPAVRLRGHDRLASFWRNLQELADPGDQVNIGPDMAVLQRTELLARESEDSSQLLAGVLMLVTQVLDLLGEPVPAYVRTRAGQWQPPAGSSVTRLTLRVVQVC